MATATWIEGNSPGGNHGSRLTNKSLEQTQAQVDQVVGTMKMNLTNVLERDQRLSYTDDRATALQVGALQFEQSAANLKRKYWWNNIKMIILMCVIAVVILIVIVIWATRK